MKLTVLAAVALSSVPGQPLPQSRSHADRAEKRRQRWRQRRHRQHLDESAIPQTPDYSSGWNNCARPTPPQVKVVDGAGGSNCAVETLEEPIIRESRLMPGLLQLCETNITNAEERREQRDCTNCAVEQPDDSGQSHLADYPNDGCAKFAHPGQRAAA